MKKNEYFLIWVNYFQFIKGNVEIYMIVYNIEIVNKNIRVNYRDN